LRSHRAGSWRRARLDDDLRRVKNASVADGTGSSRGGVDSEHVPAGQGMGASAAYVRTVGDAIRKLFRNEVENVVGSHAATRPPQTEVRIDSRGSVIVSAETIDMGNRIMSAG
jgi:hypothetical protein